MTVHINRDGCISCGLCADICPDVFQMASDNLAEVIVDQVPEEFEEDVIEAQESCPVSVIEAQE